jgi:hypothetical protein
MSAAVHLAMAPRYVTEPTQPTDVTNWYDSSSPAANARPCSDRGGLPVRSCVTTGLKLVRHLCRCRSGRYTRTSESGSLPPDWIADLPGREAGTESARLSFPAQLHNCRQSCSARTSGSAAVRALGDRRCRCARGRYLRHAQRAEPLRCVRSQGHVRGAAVSRGSSTTTAVSLGRSAA